MNSITSNVPPSSIPERVLIQGPRVLSLDGGGVRGLSCLVILENIFHRLNHLQENAGRPEIHPWQYFDLIGGSNTGGIIALMLGRLRMSIEDCIVHYERISEAAFGARCSGESDCMFDAESLKRAIEAVIEQFDPSGNADAPLLETGTLRPSLRSYHSAEERPCKFKMWQATRATSAIPRIFRGLQKGDDIWVDASTKFKNPSQWLLREISYITHEQMDGIPAVQRLSLMLSLGTGKTNLSDLDEPRAGELAAACNVDQAMLKIMTDIANDTENTHFEMLERFKDADPGIYHRYNVEMGLNEVKPFAAEKITKISQVTESYLTSPGMRDTVLKTVRHMHDILPPRWEPNDHNLPAVGSISSPEDSELLMAIAEVPRRELPEPALSRAPTLTEPVVDLRQESDVLERQLDKYWGHLSVKAIKLYTGTYEKIRAANNSDNLLTRDAIDRGLGVQSVQEEKAKEIWNRLHECHVRHKNCDSELRFVNKSMATAYMYMLHIEIFDSEIAALKPEPKFDHGDFCRRPKLRSPRKEKVQSFHKFALCKCEADRGYTCGREWNFAASWWGIAEASTAKLCEFARLSEEYRQSLGQQHDTLLTETEDATARRIRDATFEAWKNLD